MSMYLAGRHVFSTLPIEVNLVSVKKKKEIKKKKKKNAYEAFRKRRVVYWKSMGCAVRGNKWSKDSFSKLMKIVHVKH